MPETFDRTPVNIIRALTVLLGCQLAGEAIVTTVRAFFPFVAFPGPVLGMALLFGLLVWRRGPDSHLQSTGLGLLRNLSLLFVPATVGFIQQGELLARYGWLIVTSLVISAALTMTVTVLTFQFVAKRLNIDDQDKL